MDRALRRQKNKADQKKNVAIHETGHVLTGYLLFGTVEKAEVYSSKKAKETGYSGVTTLPPPTQAPLLHRAAVLVAGDVASYMFTTQNEDQIALGGMGDRHKLWREELTHNRLSLRRRRRLVSQAYLFAENLILCHEEAFWRLCEAILCGPLDEDQISAIVETSVCGEQAPCGIMAVWTSRLTGKSCSSTSSSGRNGQVSRCGL